MIRVVLNVQQRKAKKEDKYGDAEKAGKHGMNITVRYA